MSKKIIIIGAGEAGRMVVREIASHPESGLEPVGFLDDDASLHGSLVEGYPVLGPCRDLPGVTAKMAIEEALIAVPSAGREFVRRIVALCRDAGLPFKIVPGLIEIIKGPVHLEQIREVHPEDLLGRETVEFDEGEIARAIAGRKVLVTGAGGSIGGEICRQLARFAPSELFILGRGENQIYEIEYDLKNRFPELPVRTIIADVRDFQGLRHAFERAKPHFVYHTAAHKHVHYMEFFPSEAVKNNIFGTANVIKASEDAGAERLVMLSTDKAARPRGVMGATKRMAEYLVCMASQAGGLKAVAVRFGNVLGSRGSVVPLFMRQIRNKQPVTISHPDATRFFMTLREACMLVVQASIMGEGGEIFILRMGQPIKITEIAKDIITLHGLRPEVDVPLKVVGLRPGEKLHEDLVAEGEKLEKSQHEYIYVSRPVVPEAERLLEAIDDLERLMEIGDEAGIKKVLNRVIPDADLG